MKVTKVILARSDITTLEKLLKAFHAFRDEREMLLVRVGDSLIKWGHLQDRNLIEIQINPKS